MSLLAQCFGALFLGFIVGLIFMVPVMAYGGTSFDDSAMQLDRMERCSAGKLPSYQCHFSGYEEAQARKASEDSWQ